jgi:hypothetical protein
MGARGPLPGPTNPSVTHRPSAHLLPKAIVEAAMLRSAKMLAYGDRYEKLAEREVTKAEEEATRSPRTKLSQKAPEALKTAIWCWKEALLIQTRIIGGSSSLPQDGDKDPLDELARRRAERTATG